MHSVANITSRKHKKHIPLLLHRAFGRFAVY